ncbi:hypothetical protein L195_g039631 [Trifolium pratense]|uniref:Uncharacterized protein n=1 Tax=Trifolium pratense TaxID=57577 RepID=A0A2K3LYH2_TRIPR|nr:hypothetical protein L195_g039631 [Trifolium pratense]
MKTGSTDRSVLVVSRIAPSVMSSISLSRLSPPSSTHLKPLLAIHRTTPRLCLTLGEGGDRNRRSKLALEAA